METILLRAKDREIGPLNLAVFDDLVDGFANGNLFVVALSGKVFPLEWIIELYQFPRKNGESTAKLLWALKGGRPEMMSKVEFYDEPDEIIIPKIIIPKLP